MQLVQILIYAVLALIMFSIGSSLRTKDFIELLRHRRPLIVGLILQMVFLPIMAFVIAATTDLPAAFKVGLFVVALCPGGTTSNYISYIVKADVALSIALTCINSLIILGTIPLLSQFALAYFMDIPDAPVINVWNTFVQVFAIIIIPALLGVLFNDRYTDLSKKYQSAFKYGTTLLLGIIFIIMFFVSKSDGGSGISPAEIILLLPYCLLLHLGSMLLSYYIARLLQISNLQATTIGIEVGLQNTALALLVTGTLIGDPEMTKPALVYTIFSFFTTLMFAFIARRES